jgi:dTDP-4-dehydrorhamnose reductase
VAQEAARLLAVASPHLVPISVHDHKLRAARPQFAALSNAKLSGVGIGMPHWREALARHIRRKMHGPDVKSGASRQ